MIIEKYIKKGNGNYQILFDNGKKINFNENIILKYNLLYKKEIDSELLKEIICDNEKYEIYDKCVKYIGVRIRSINEIREYMVRKNIDDDTISKVIDKLIRNGLLNDDMFTKAYVHDKLTFTTMGPYRIEFELKKHKIDDKIISKYINNIDKEIIDIKVNKQINKLINSGKNKNNLRNKIYNNLKALGYSSEVIVNNLNKYNF